MKPRSNQAAGQTARPGRREIVRGSRVYPMSGPLPRGKATVRSEAQWGHGESGGAAASESSVQEIPQRQWVHFFNDFNRRHAGWLAEVEVLERGKGARVEARRLPFEGITADTKQGALNTLSVILEMQSNVHLTHMIPRTRQVQVKEEPDTEIQITAANGERTIVHFQSPPRSPRVLPTPKTKRTEAG